MSRDVALLRERLEPVEAHASTLAWADKRPWRARTHVGQEGPLPVIDLHDLDRRGARQVTTIVCDLGAELDAGAVQFITGKGRHSTGSGGVLVHTVRKELQEACAARGWRFRPGRAGWILVVDEARAPRVATGALGPLFWILAAGLAVAAVVALANELGLLK